jgi:hypothetical protein
MSADIVEENLLLSLFGCREPLAHFRRDLAVRHLVHDFNSNDQPFEALALQTLFKLTLGLPGTKDLNRVGVPDYRAEFSIEPPYLCLSGLTLLKSM